jgi:hypothetical protein
MSKRMGWNFHSEMEDHSPEVGTHCAWMIGSGIVVVGWSLAPYGQRNGLLAIYRMWHR